jgi:molybdopterin converting factor small subunit
MAKALNITVKLFATYRQFLPVHARSGAYELQVPVDTRVGELLGQVGLPHDKQSDAVLLVNGRHSGPQRLLQDGDVVSAFPAIAGG